MENFKVGDELYISDLSFVSKGDTPYNPFAYEYFPELFGQHAIVIGEPWIESHPEIEYGANEFNRMTVRLDNGDVYSISAGSWHRSSYKDAMDLKASMGSLANELSNELDKYEVYDE